MTLGVVDSLFPVLLESGLVGASPTFANFGQNHKSTYFQYTSNAKDGGEQCSSIEILIYNRKGGTTQLSLA